MLRVHLGSQVLCLSSSIFEAANFLFAMSHCVADGTILHFWWFFYETFVICIYSPQLHFIYVYTLYKSYIAIYLVFYYTQRVKLDVFCPWMWSTQPMAFAGFGSGPEATSRQPTMHRRDVVRLAFVGEQWLPWWFDVAENLRFHCIYIDIPMYLYIYIHVSKYSVFRETNGNIW